MQLQAPISLASSLQDYLNDPNFEHNRLEYKASKAAGDRNAKDRNGAPPGQVPKGVVSVIHLHPTFFHDLSRYSYNLNELNYHRNISQPPAPTSV